ncbi:MAG TPA: alanine racemase C-terminal domain-containing protein [Microbacteriaceae bacterium]
MRIVCVSTHMSLSLIDDGDSDISIGDSVEIISDENTVEKLSSRASTINYEIVTRMGSRPRRTYGGS